MANVVGNAETIINSNAVGISIVVVAKSTPYMDAGGSLVLSGSRRYFTDADGGFGFTLQAGYYEVTFDGRDKFVINVPNDNDSHPFGDLVVEGVGEPPPAVPPEYPGWPSFPADSDFQLTSDGRLVAYNPECNKYYTLYVRGLDPDAPVWRMSEPRDNP